VFEDKTRSVQPQGKRRRDRHTNFEKKKNEIRTTIWKSEIPRNWKRRDLVRLPNPTETEEESCKGKSIIMKTQNQQKQLPKQGTLEEICEYSNLEKAFKLVKKNKGTPGIDRITIKEYEANLFQNLEQLRKEVLNWTYKPTPVKRVEIPKPDGKGYRKLGIPIVRDRILHTAIKIVLEPKIDSTFSERSYGFRPGKNQRQAVEKAREFVREGKDQIVDIDLAQFFDRINHDRLIHRLKTYVQDKRVLRLIGMILRTGIMTEGVVISYEEGSVQGSPLSPLLSNVVLDELDKELEKRGLHHCRFADDWAPRRNAQCISSPIKDEGRSLGTDLQGWVSNHLETKDLQWDLREAYKEKAA